MRKTDIKVGGDYAVMGHRAKVLSTDVPSASSRRTSGVRIVWCDEDYRAGEERVVTSRDVQMPWSEFAAIEAERAAALARTTTMRAELRSLGEEAVTRLQTAGAEVFSSNVVCRYRDGVEQDFSIEVKFSPSGLRRLLEVLDGVDTGSSDGSSLGKLLRSHA